MEPRTKSAVFLSLPWLFVRVSYFSESLQPSVHIVLLHLSLVPVLSYPKPSIVVKFLHLTISIGSYFLSVDVLGAGESSDWTCSSLVLVDKVSCTSAGDSDDSAPSLRTILKSSLFVSYRQGVRRVARLAPSSCCASMQPAAVCRTCTRVRS